MELLTCRCEREFIVPNAWDVFLCKCGLRWSKIMGHWFTHGGQRPLNR